MDNLSKEVQDNLNETKVESIQIVCLLNPKFCRTESYLTTKWSRVSPLVQSDVVKLRPTMMCDVLEHLGKIPGEGG